MAEEAEAVAAEPVAEPAAEALPDEHDDPPPPTRSDPLVAACAVQGAPNPPFPAPPLPLAGLTFVVSDSLDVEGTVTGFGSPAWAATHGPAAEHAAAVGTCVQSGAACVGKAVCDELCYALTGANPHFGTTRNPAAPTRLAGGSASGTAAAVSAGQADFGVAVDTLGCVRVPAAHCGIYAYRPTAGAIDVAGAVPVAPALDAVGVVSADAAKLLTAAQALLGVELQPAARPPRQLIWATDVSVLSTFAARAAVTSMVSSITGTGVVVPNDVVGIDLGKHLLQQCPSLNHFRADESGHGLDAVTAAMRTIAGVQVWKGRKAWVESKSPELGDEIGLRLSQAARLNDDILAAALQVQKELKEAMDNVLKDDALLVLPTTPCAPPALGEPTRDTENWRLATLRLTALAGMCGLPQASTPMPIAEAGADGPVAVSLVGRGGADASVLIATLGFSEGARKLFPEQLAKCKEVNAEAAKERDAAAKGPAKAPAKPAPAPAPGPGDALKEKGNAAFKAGKYDEAVRHYGAAINKDTRNAVLYSNRAMAHLKLGDFKSAEEDCTLALALDPRNVKALLRRGTARGFQQTYTDALADYQAVLRLEPNNKDARTEVQRMRVLLGDTEQ